jgi:rhomboid protease GlpG
MRLIGHLPNEASAATFSDYLYVEGITNEVESVKDGWAVWIHSEDEWHKAKEMLAAFLGNPADPRYRKQAAQARQLKAVAAAKEDETEGRLMDRARVFRATMPYGVGPLTCVLVGLSLAVQCLSVAGYEERILQELYMTAITVNDIKATWLPGLPEISQGEFWRLFTPVLVHGGWVHLLLNMMWLLDLGSMIEGRRSTGLMGLLVVVLAVSSNLGQYLMFNAYFGGMSGVVFGLLGYVWMKGKFDPSSGMFLHPHTVAMMLIWFFLCLTGVIPNIANGAHAVGLTLGVVWGFLASVPAMRRRSR